MAPKRNSDAKDRRRARILLVVVVLGFVVLLVDCPMVFKGSRAHAEQCSSECMTRFGVGGEVIAVEKRQWQWPGRYFADYECRCNLR